MVIYANTRTKTAHLKCWCLHVSMCMENVFTLILNVCPLVRKMCFLDLEHVYIPFVPCYKHPNITAVHVD